MEREQGRGEWRGGGTGRMLVGMGGSFVQQLFHHSVNGLPQQLLIGRGCSPYERQPGLHVPRPTARLVASFASAAGAAGRDCLCWQKHRVPWGAADSCSCRGGETRGGRQRLQMPLVRRRPLGSAKHGADSAPYTVRQPGASVRLIIGGVNDFPGTLRHCFSRVVAWDFAQSSDSSRRQRRGSARESLGPSGGEQRPRPNAPPIGRRGALAALRATTAVETALCGSDRRGSCYLL
mmetsp:Transcript_33196/g.94028  ORF Transcript_33196/g.94028 Transcript_33196/m.94028 type:complete len:235 (-) Transcript_33196:126-830(-)